VRVGITYDFGVIRGGGDFVMLNVIEAPSNKGYDVSLTTSNLRGFYETAEFFTENTPNVDLQNIKVPRFLKHPYTIAYMANKTVRSGGYDVYIASDDIPKCISDKKGAYYVHYPHAARLKFEEYIADRYKKTLSGRLVWHAHRTLFRKFYPANALPENWLLVVNSTVSRKHVVECVRNPIGRNMSFRRYVFEKVGYFKGHIGRFGKRLVGSEEAEFSARLLGRIPNTRIIYDPSAVVYHKVPKSRTSFRYLMKRSFCEGVSKRLMKRLNSNSTDVLSVEKQYLKYLFKVSITLRLRQI